MSEIIIYEDPDVPSPVQVTLEGETLWLTQAQMAALFQVKPQNITMHLKNIYAGGELEEAATCKDFLQVQTEGARQVDSPGRTWISPCWRCFDGNISR